MLAIIVAIFVGLGCAAVGWNRAAKKPGADKMQHAIGYGFVGFLVFIVSLVLAGRFGALA